jgi:HSP20 family protein|tara:strand:+ start:92 stop:466 length:375 start_codon:yes stop_codon:yes gene_type:complete
MWRGRDRELLEMWSDLLSAIEGVPHYTTRPTSVNPNRDVQVNEENGTITITAELAGLDKSQVDVEVSNRSVIITAESEKKEFAWDRTFTYEIDPESVEATMVNGVLDMTIEKKEKTSAKKVEIK